MLILVPTASLAFACFAIISTIVPVERAIWAVRDYATGRDIIWKFAAKSPAWMPNLTASESEFKAALAAVEVPVVRHSTSVLTVGKVQSVQDEGATWLDESAG